MPNLKELSLGILTWMQPGNLKRVLGSYEAAGLLQAVGEVNLFANASDPREIALAHRFGLNLMTSPMNIGIGPAFARLAESSTRRFFLFLENDWLCIEPQLVVERRLQLGMQLLDEGQAGAVRFRHRSRYGHPLYSRKHCEGNELAPDNLRHLLDVIYWNEHPEAAFPNLIANKVLGGENWYFARSANAAYTNNPTLYLTEFVRSNIAPRSNAPGIASESLLQEWWRSQNLTVAQGEGLFKHHDPGKEWRRAAAILGRWSGRRCVR